MDQFLTLALSFRWRKLHLTFYLTQLKSWHLLTLNWWQQPCGKNFYFFLNILDCHIQKQFAGCYHLNWNYRYHIAPFRNCFRREENLIHLFHRKPSPPMHLYLNQVCLLSCSICFWKLSGLLACAYCRSWLSSPSRLHQLHLVILQETLVPFPQWIKEKHSSCLFFELLLQSY